MASEYPGCYSGCHCSWGFSNRQMYLHGCRCACVSPLSSMVPLLVSYISTAPLFRMPSGKVFSQCPLSWLNQSSVISGTPIKRKDAESAKTLCSDRCGTKNNSLLTTFEKSGRIAGFVLQRWGVRCKSTSTLLLADSRALVIKLLQFNCLLKELILSFFLWSYPL